MAFVVFNPPKSVRKGSRVQGESIDSVLTVQRVMNMGDGVRLAIVDRPIDPYLFVRRRLAEEVAKRQEADAAQGSEN